MDSNLVTPFARLFQGRTDAYGEGEGKVTRLYENQQTDAYWHALYEQHLDGGGTGIGVFPLLDDGTCWFAAIDLDEPDFERAQRMREYLGFAHTWLERSRSGNAHIWCFFKRPCQSWVARGLLREAAGAVDRERVELFPKQDKLRQGMLGNYINLPYHGKNRVMLDNGLQPIDLDIFIFEALTPEQMNDPDDWEKRAHWLMIPTPEERVQARADFGTQAQLHVCAEYIIENRDANPVMPGHRNVVLFCLAKQLANYEGFDHEECLEMLQLVNESSPEPLTNFEIERILTNAERGEFTSTGCSDPLFQPYASPDCPIAKLG